jgi:hypothetical protein
MIKYCPYFDQTNIIGDGTCLSSLTASPSLASTGTVYIADDVPISSGGAKRKCWRERGVANVLEKKIICVKVAT